MPIGVYVPLHTARTLWPKGGVYPVLVPRYMLVPRDTVRSMHKVMRLVHGLRYWLAGLGCWVCLGSLLAGFFARAWPPPIAYACKL